MYDSDTRTQNIRTTTIALAAPVNHMFSDGLDPTTETPKVCEYREYAKVEPPY